MTAQELAVLLTEALCARGVDAALGEAVQYGHAVRLWQEGRPVGSLKVYCGKRGPKLTTNELRGPHAPHLAQLAEAAFDDVLRVGAPGSRSGVHVWVDGSFVGASGGWAYLVVVDGAVVHEASGCVALGDVDGSRNVAGEITAVVEALRWCAEHHKTAVTVHHDYEGLAKWVLGEWRTKQDLTRQYVGDVRALGLQLTWVKVLAHSGDAFNERVDYLARCAAQGGNQRAATGQETAVSKQTRGLRSTRSQEDAYRGRLLELAERWRAYGRGANFDWSELRQALRETGTRDGRSIPEDEGDPAEWHRLALALVECTEHWEDGGKR